MRTELGVAGDECLAVTVANYRRHKDYPALFAAARDLHDRGVPVRFAAVGQGPLASEVQAARARAGLGETFRLLGYRTDALDVLGAADLFVLSSRQEGLPVALMEALALGLPVVATSVGGVHEIVRDGSEGLLVPPNRPDKLADAIARMASDPELRARLAQSSARRATDYDVRRAVRSYEQSYAALVTS